MKFIFFIWFALVNITFTFANQDNPIDSKDTLGGFTSVEIKKLHKAESIKTDADKLFKEADQIDKSVQELKAKPGSESDESAQDAISKKENKESTKRVDGYKLIQKAHAIEYTLYKDKFSSFHTTFKGDDKSGKQLEVGADEAYGKAQDIFKEVSRYTNPRVVDYRMADAVKLEQQAINDLKKALNTLQTNSNQSAKDTVVKDTSSFKLSTSREKQTVLNDSVQKVDTIIENSLNTQAITTSAIIFSKDTLSSATSNNQTDTSRFVSGEPVTKGSKTAGFYTDNGFLENPQTVNNEKKELPKLENDSSKFYQSVQEVHPYLTSFIPAYYFDSIKVDYGHMELFRQFVVDSYRDSTYGLDALGRKIYDFDSFKKAWYAYIYGTDQYYDSLNEELSRSTAIEINKASSEGQLVYNEQMIKANHKALSNESLSTSDKNIVGSKTTNAKTTKKKKAFVKKNGKNAQIIANKNTSLPVAADTITKFSVHPVVQPDSSAKIAEIHSTTNDLNEKKAFTSDSGKKDISSISTFAGNSPSIINNLNEKKSFTPDSGKMDVSSTSTFAAGNNSTTSNELNEKKAFTSDSRNKNVSSPSAFVGINPSDIIYRIQIAANHTPINQEKLREIYSGNRQVEFFTEDGWFKYSIGSFASYKEAREYKKQVLVEGSFIVAFQNGAKVGVGLQRSVKQEISSINSDKTLVSFSVQIAACRMPLSDEFLHRIFKGSQKIDMIQENGWYKYSINAGKTYSEASETKRNCRVVNAFIVAYSNGQRLKISNALEIVHELNKDK
jgi:hypothetical protein